MTRPQDTWNPKRVQRVTTIRYGTVTATPAAGSADITVSGGPALTAVPVYGPTTVGTPVLVFHDGEKAVGVTGATAAPATGHVFLTTPTVGVTSTEKVLLTASLAAGSWDIHALLRVDVAANIVPRLIVRLRQGSLTGTQVDGVIHSTNTTAFQEGIPMLASLVLAATTDIVVTAIQTVAGVTGTVNVSETRFLARTY
jgi:hypothetical protein